MNEVAPQVYESLVQEYEKLQKEREEEAKHCVTAVQHFREANTPK